jgi:hypothetical protein
MSGGFCEPCHRNGSTEHRAAVGHFFMLNSVTMSPQHMEKYGRSLDMMQYQKHKYFVGRKKYFLKVETLLKISSTADDHRRHGQVATQQG